MTAKVVAKVAAAQVRNPDGRAALERFAVGALVNAAERFAEMAPEVLVDR